jgi:hypothetical protein
MVISSFFVYMHHSPMDSPVVQVKLELFSAHVHTHFLYLSVTGTDRWDYDISVDLYLRWF